MKKRFDSSLIIDEMIEVNSNNLIEISKLLKEHEPLQYGTG